MSPTATKRRRRPEPEVIRLTAGQRPTAEAPDDEDAEPKSQRRPVFPGRENIEEIFREAGRYK